MSPVRCILAAFLMLPLVGCGWFGSPQTRVPQLYGPSGSAEYQQYRAERVVDPYPDNTVGPPVVGGRPRGFEKPLAETPRSQNRPRYGGWLGAIGF